MGSQRLGRDWATELNIPLHGNKHMLFIHSSLLDIWIIFIFSAMKDYPVMNIYLTPLHKHMLSFLGLNSRMQLLGQIVSFLSTFFFFFLFWPHHEAYGILVPWPGIVPGPWQWKLWVLTTGLSRNSLASLFKKMPNCFPKCMDYSHQQWVLDAESSFLHIFHIFANAWYCLYYYYYYY